MPAIWTPPITWVVDQLVTEADLNQQVRDNLEFLYAGLAGYALLRDEKPQNTDGGTFTSGAWQTRDLNTEVFDPRSLASLSANRVTLAAGTYRVRISCPAYGCNEHQARLYNVTDGVEALMGTMERSSVYNTARSLIIGRLTLAAQKTFEVQHRCETTRSTDGFGVAGNFGLEVYTVAEFWKEA